MFSGWCGKPAVCEIQQGGGQEQDCANEEVGHSQGGAEGYEGEGFKEAGVAFQEGHLLVILSVQGALNLGEDLARGGRSSA